MESELKIEGMSCSACVGHVTKALSAVDGVESVNVTLTPGFAKVSFDPTKADLSALINAVEDEGYSAVPA